MNFYASVTGFTLLTVAIILGAVWGTYLARTLSIDPRRPVYLDPKVLVAFGTWVLYGLAILGRKFKSWKGPRMAYSSLFGFVVVLFSLFAVNFFLTKFHVFVS